MNNNLLIFSIACQVSPSSVRISFLLVPLKPCFTYIFQLPTIRTGVLIADGMMMRSQGGGVVRASKRKITHHFLQYGLPDDNVNSNVEDDENLEGVGGRSKELGSSDNTDDEIDEEISDDEGDEENNLENNDEDEEAELDADDGLDDGYAEDDGFDDGYAEDDGFDDGYAEDDGFDDGYAEDDGFDDGYAEDDGFDDGYAEDD